MKKMIIYMIFVVLHASSIMGLQKELESVARKQKKLEKRAYERRNEIIITDHARQQMQERGISVNDVEKTIKYGIRSVQGHDKSIKYLRDNVIVVMDASGRRVITVYPSNKKEGKFLSAREKSLKSKKEKQKRKGPPSSLTPETKSFIRSLNPK